ncbi:MAG: SURF1 family protein [Gammaproteobacteria bacterium]|nr:SURF1 family protein [Gammaproteobacteria bacterium]
MAEFSLKLGRYVFKPALIPSLITFVVLPLLLSLGFWQLSRAHQKEALQKAFATQMQLPYAPIDQIDLGANDSRYRGIHVRGHYDAAHQILLDNQVQDGMVGFHVYTPLLRAGNEPAIFVNRGWIPLGTSRQQLPDIRVNDTDVEIWGRVSQPANPGIFLGNVESTGQWPRVVQHMNYAELAGALDYPLAPAVILLDSDAAEGYRREWRPVAEGFGPERHRGYAVQWFSLAIALIAIYLVVNTRAHGETDSQPE